MKPLLGISLIMASIGWAAPIAISGYAYTNIGIHVYGPDGFEFDSTGGSGAWHPYGQCVPDRACDLSGGTQNYGLLDGGFFASDGSKSVGVNGGPLGTPPGFPAFSITWIAKPVYLDTLPGVPDANYARQIGVIVPITVFGTVAAWTEQELESNSAPFFDYAFSGRGTLAVSAYLHYTDVLPVSLSSASFLGAEATFTGIAEPVPEPAAWWLALPALAVVLFRRNRRDTGSVV